MTNPLRTAITLTAAILMVLFATPTVFLAAAICIPGAVLLMMGVRAEIAEAREAELLAPHAHWISDHEIERVVTQWTADAGGVR